MSAKPSGGNDRRLRVGRLVKAHGLKGALKLELYTDDPQARFVPGAEFTLQVPDDSPWFEKTLTVREYRVLNGNSVVFFDDVPDRTAAESLVRAILWVDEAKLHDTGDENAWYDHQLVGLDVRRDGVSVGTLARVDHLPAHDLLAVSTQSGEVLVPFVQAFVPTVDLDGGYVEVTPPGGLFEELDDASDLPEQTADEALADEA